MVNPVYSPSPARYDSGIRFRRCGRSGVLLPEISLGLWHNFGDTCPLANSLEMAHYAFDHGIVHFDLANNYGPSYGSAEETFGASRTSQLEDNFKALENITFSPEELQAIDQACNCAR